MDLRDQRGAISGAEGCMMGAMALFALLLIGLLVISFFRFQEPPKGPPGNPNPMTGSQPAVAAPQPQPRPTTGDR